MATKRCSRCEKRVSLDQFVKNIKSPDGLNHYCKPCKKKIMAAYFATSEGKAAMKRMVENKKIKRQQDRKNAKRK